VTSIFFGGGTPSLFEGPAIASILERIGNRLDVAADAEITLEANPGAIEAGRFESFRNAGVNRLSLGAQSFSDAALGALGRVHNAAEIHAAWHSAVAAGFSNINLDLMYGLPAQTAQQALADVEQALQLGAPHLSHYQLTVEPNTRFFRHPPDLPDEDTLLEMERLCRQRILAAGLERYEISAFARAGWAARHNINYWRFGDYLGIGAGAHSKLTMGGRQRRLARRRNPEAYLRHAGTPLALTDCRDLSAQDLAFEFMLNRLRLTAPFPTAEFEAATGLPFDGVRDTLEALQAQGLTTHSAAGWGVSRRGRELLNEVVEQFLPQ